MEVLLFLAALTLSACGLEVPNIGERWDGQDGTVQVEFEIKKTIFCELRRAVIANVDTTYLVGGHSHFVKEPILPDNWGAQVSLSLEVDESTAINPGVAFNEPFENAIVHFASGNITAAQSFSLPFGATISSQAARTDKFDPYWTIAFLKRPISDDSVCNTEHPKNDPFVRNGEIPAKSSPLVSDLKIKEWLTDSLFTYSLLASDGSGATPDTIGIEIKFIIVTSGNISPTWKLVRFSGNNGSLPLFSTGRTRTHDLIITIGPSNQKTLNTHLASQIGQAVNGNRTPSIAPAQQ